MTDVPFLSVEHPIRFAHRGSRVLWPENTVYAFDQAIIGLGYRYLELDVRCSRDGVPMVVHDSTLERTTNGSGAVADWDVEDLANLDAAYHFDAESGYPMRGKGVKIPTLREIYELFPDAHINIDLKAAGIEWQVAEVIRRCRAEDRSLAGAFRDGRIARFKRITKGTVAVSAGPRSASTLYAASRVGVAIDLGFAAYQLPYRFGALRIDRRMIDTVHKAGAHIHLWTVNDPDDMKRFLDLGVDGIVTDRPDILNDVIDERTQEE